MKSGIVIIVDSAHGQYIPQIAAECLVEGWTISEEDRNILLSGPDHDEYWDSWDNVLCFAEYTDSEGNIWHLHHDGDLFAYCPELMTSEEWVNLGFDINEKPSPIGWCKLEVCQDCLMYLANNELPTDSNTERDKAIVDGVHSLHHPAVDGHCLGFSYSPCDCCQSPLGGDRYLVYEKERGEG